MDRGAASLWLLAAGFVLVLAGMVGAVVGAATVARHRARTGADLGALAGAVNAVQGDVAACAAADRIVRANGGRLTACRVDDLDISVAVEVPVTGVPGPPRTAVAVARAGPIRSSGATATATSGLVGVAQHRQEPRRCP